LGGCGKKEQPSPPPPPPPKEAARTETPRPAAASISPQTEPSSDSRTVSGGTRSFLEQAKTAARGLLAAKAQTESGTSAPTTIAALTQGEVGEGLKQALSKGIQYAIKELGREDGFLKNLNVKIPMPQKLLQVEKTLRTLKQDHLADEFIATMNHAAEKAVPEASAIFGDAIRQMTLEDAKTILMGPPDAATQYFRKKSETQLTEKMLPIVRKATESTGVTSAYKNLMAKAAPLAQFLGQDAQDVDGYVTQKSLDGLFKMIAEQEKEIRSNPVSRTTDLLKKVFGSKFP
jgi:hypothetical protein